MKELKHFKSSQIILSRDEVIIIERYIRDMNSKLTEAFDYIEGDFTDATLFPNGSYNPNVLIKFLVDISNLTVNINKFLSY